MSGAAHASSARRASSARAREAGAERQGRASRAPRTPTPPGAANRQRRAEEHERRRAGEGAAWRRYGYGALGGGGRPVERIPGDPRLNQQRAEHEQHVGDVDIGAHPVGEHGTRVSNTSAASAPAARPNQRAAKPVHDPAARREREEGERHDDALRARGPSGPEEMPSASISGCGVGAIGQSVLRGLPARELLPPDERVEGVVVDEADTGHQPQQERPEDAGEDRQPSASSSGRPRRRPHAIPARAPRGAPG